jgi:PAS domain S-box-containing protein
MNTKAVAGKLFRGTGTLIRGAARLSAWRYAIAVVAVAMSFALRVALTRWVGPGLPTYITFYPAVMVAAITAGFGSGLFASVLAALTTWWWILHPIGQFAIASPVDRVGLVTFVAMGIFMSFVAELYHRDRRRVALYVQDAALRESQSRLAAFAKATFEGIVEKSAGRIVDCNEQFARIIGYSVAELRGMELADLTVAEDRDRVMAHVRDGCESIIEYGMLRKDGTQVIVEVQSKTIGSGNHPVHYSAVRDITARKLAEDALKQSEEQYRRLINTLIEGFCILDVVRNGNDEPVDYHFREFNPAFAQQTGVKIVPGDGVSTLPPDVATVWEGICRKTVVTAEPMRFQCEAAALNRWYDVSGLRFWTGNRLQIAVRVNDITESRRAETLLRESEARFRNIFDHAATGIAITDIQGRFVQSNAAYCTITGYSPTELKTIKVSTLVHPDDREPSMKSIRGLLEGEFASFETENRYVRKDASIVWVHKHVSLLQNERGQPTHLVALVTDSSGRKQTEETLRFLAQCGTSGSGESFFQELARYLAEAFDMHFVCIDRLHDALLSAQTLAVFHNGHFEDNVCYTLRDTPCGDVVGQQICCFPQNVRELFPKDEVLQDLQAESYLGVTLWSTLGQPIGLIAVIGRQPLTNTRRAESLLQVVAVRAAHELERQQADEKLRESEERMQMALDVSRSFAFEWDTASDRVSRSDSCARVLSLSAGSEATQDTGQRFFQRIHTDDRDRFVQILSGLKPSADTYRTEYRVVCGDGRMAVLEEAGRGFFHADGSLRRLVGVTTDITERKRAERELQQSREDLDRAQDVGQIGSWRLDVRRNILTWSAENYRIFGVPSGTPLSYQTFLDAVHPDDRMYVDSQWQDGLNGKPYDIEHRIVVQDQVKWVREKAYLEFDDAGKLLGGFGITQDVTERKQTEERIRVALAEKDVLLKEIHHRVKNNMQVVSSLLALQAGQLADQAMHAILQDVTHRVRSMALVHEKLYQSVNMAHIEFADYAKSLLSYLWRAHETSTAGVQLKLDLESVLLSINAAVPCGLVLNELVSNSLKHAFLNGACGEIAVSLRRVTDGQVCLRVRDNGAGLPPDFDWRQADTLGLRLVQLLAGQLGATVEMSDNEGTEFAVTFGEPRA